MPITWEFQCYRIPMSGRFMYNYGFSMKKKKRERENIDKIGILDLADPGVLWASKCQVKMSEDKTISGKGGWKLSSDKMCFLIIKTTYGFRSFKK